jgi:hypothetical protein
MLAVGWKENARHWRSLVGYAHHLHELFSLLPVSSAAMHRYLLFLYYVGEQSLPDAFIAVAAKLKTGAAKELLVQGENTYLLESLLQRHVYARPLELKQRLELRSAVLYLLDQLVEAGSSAAFRMRDDFCDATDFSGDMIRASPDSLRSRRGLGSSSKVRERARSVSSPRPH